ncbi:hypothetical protein RQP46_002225 [Phenoliferia psychrophenolica]
MHEALPMSEEGEKEASAKVGAVPEAGILLHSVSNGEDGGYRLYRRRFAGCFALVVFNTVCAMNWVLFSAIAIDTGKHFGISLTRVNWLANIVCGMYLLAAPFTPFLVHRISIRGVAGIAAALLLLGSWMRYAATASYFNDRPGGAYGLLFMGSLLIGIAQCWFQIVPPAYSELWFNQRGRTTSTMIMAIANPFGGAIGDLIAPVVVTNPSDLPSLLLIIAIVSTAVFPLVTLIGRRPRTPPTRSAEAREVRNKSDGLKTAKALVGVGDGGIEGGSGIGWRERSDFWLIALIFTVLIGFFDAFLTLTNQIFEPEGYSSDVAGYIGACVIVSGIFGAAITAPLFDRYFHFRLALAGKILTPVIGVSFLALIWAVKPHDLPGIFVLAVLLGVSSFTMLPVALELAAEVVWEVASPATTSAILYFFGNGFSVVTVVGMNALQADSSASPPNHMHKALIFQGVFVFVTSLTIFGLRGIQARKQVDTGHSP